jgi:hypothetical protein
MKKPHIIKESSKWVLFIQNTFGPQPFRAEFDSIGALADFYRGLFREGAHLHFRGRLFVA